MQIMIQDFSKWDALGHYRWGYGLSDSNGTVISRYGSIPIGQLKTANEAGELVYQAVKADPRGGVLTLCGLKSETEQEVKSGVNVPGPPMLVQSVRYGTVGGQHLFFQVTPILSQETRTNTDPTNKLTGGGKVGGSLGGIVNVEGSGSFEHGFASGSTAESRLGNVTNIQLMWLPQ